MTRIILFQKHFVQPILNGQKTQTRRLNKWVDIGDILLAKNAMKEKPFAKLLVTGFKRDYLQEISSFDIEAEGCPFKPEYRFLGCQGAAIENAPEYQIWWRNTWDSINKKAGTRWCDNPVVSVITFEVFDENKKQASRLKA